MCTRLNSISQVSQCNLFNGTDLTERDPGQKCSIAEEVANGREVAECTNKLQVSEASVYVQGDTGGLALLFVDFF